MKTNDMHFSVSRNYSDIPNLQGEAKDTYDVVPMQVNVQITFSSTDKDGTITEEKIFNSLTFSEAKSLVLFLSENGVRKTTWIDVIEDYCQRKKQNKILTHSN